MSGKFILIKSSSDTNVANLNLTSCFNETYNLYEVVTTVKNLVEVLLVIFSKIYR